MQKIVETREQQGTAIMTAGIYCNFFPENCQSDSHTLNPKTGRPVSHNLRSVTVMHEDPAWAEAWGRGLSCVGEMEAARIADAEHLKTLLVYKSDGELREYEGKVFASLQ